MNQTCTPATYTIPQFLGSHNVSRTHFYALVKEGKGPRLMKVGRRTLVSAEAAADWRKRMETETAAEDSYSKLLSEAI